MIIAKYKNGCIVITVTDILFKLHILFDSFLLNLETSSCGFIYSTALKQVAITTSNNQIANFRFERIFS